MKKKTNSGFTLSRFVLGLGMIVGVGLGAYHGSAPLATNAANGDIQKSYEQAAETYAVNAGKSPKLDALIAEAKAAETKIDAREFRPSLKLTLEHYGFLPSRK